MTRRSWLTAAGALPASLMTAEPQSTAKVRLAQGEAGPTGPASVVTRIRRLQLKHTWTTVMSSSDDRDTIFVEYHRDGITGIGEGAPIIRYHESAESAQTAIEKVTPFLRSADPAAFTVLMEEIFRRIPGEFAAKAAVDIAVLDWVSKRLGIPLCRLFGLDPASTPITTFSIGIDTAELVRKKVTEAAAFPVLKVKVGLNNDEEMIAAVRSVTNKPLRCDANEGFRTKEEAVEKILWLETQGVEFIEQPLPATNLKDMNWIRERVHMPVIADEACLHPSDIPKLAPHFDGVNVKVDKCGGLLEAWRMITMARALGLKVMLGCMVSSSVAITAAAHLSPLVDYADLDGNLLIANDPYQGVGVREGKLVLPDGPGLGLRPVEG